MTTPALLLVGEVVTMCLLLTLLRHLGRSPLWVMVYWWNPLLIKEFANSAHVDALLITFLLGVLLLTLKRKTVGACVCLAAAVGIKIWPLLLLPIVLKASVSGWRARVRGFLLFAILVGLQSLPILISGGK